MNIETTDNSPLLQECIEELINSKIDEGKGRNAGNKLSTFLGCLLYTSPSPRDRG